MVDSLGQINFTLITEITARFARSGIKADQASVDGGQEDPSAAFGAGFPAMVQPCGYTPIHQSFGILSIQIDLRIEGPALSAACGMKSDHTVESCCQVKSPIDKNRRGFKFALAWVYRSV